MKEIQLSKGKGVTLVDDDDFEPLSHWSWYLCSAGYARRTTWYRDEHGVQKPSYHHMHHCLFRPVFGFQIDHINGDRLDNRRSNLRMVTPQQQTWNRKIFSTNTTGFRGVKAIKGTSKFGASIHGNGIKVWLGTFNTAIEAHEAYVAASIKYYGDFRRIDAAPAEINHTAPVNSAGHTP